ncbi:ATP-binding protein [Desulfovibrio sp.]|uniref:AAA family ATPase n=1 Tax=Desulfovibrio sp. TaxID=885 RepID=UPI00263808D1|nr:ATP-binding protein [Desulfovibrio sp.]
MPQAIKQVNPGNKAMLFNVSLCVNTLEKAISRLDHLPGITVFYGPSGFGKSTAAAVAMTNLDAYYVQAQSSWTRKAVHLAILKSMGINPAKTVYEMGDQIATQLVNSERPLIIDEADHLVNKGIIETIRDIYEASQAPIMLIGEEFFPANLKRWERFHGRILSWAPAAPASYEDAAALRQKFATRVSIADDLLELVHRESKGSVRRICVNLERIQQVALSNGLKAMDVAGWGSRELYTGEAPSRRLSV